LIARAPAGGATGGGVAVPIFEPVIEAAWAHGIVRYLLFENINGQWSRYQDHPLPIPKPAYVPDMSAGYVQLLSVGLHEYDYVAQNGLENLDAWIANAVANAAK
jgi:hypothetical protein